MTTLHEELPMQRKHSLDLIVDAETEEEKEDYEGSDAKSDFYNKTKSANHRRRTMPTSRTLDSLVEYAPKTSTPSANSSGYGSQAVSSTNLTSEDSMSCRSISVDDTPDMDLRPTTAESRLEPTEEELTNVSKR